MITDFVVDHISTADSDITMILPPDLTSISGAGSLSFDPFDDSSKETLRITANIDNTVEGGESFTLTLVDPMGSSCPNGNREDPYILNFEIIDNDGRHIVNQKIK